MPTLGQGRGPFPPQAFFLPAVAAGATFNVFAGPVVASVANSLMRRLAFGAFMVHSVVGTPVPHRKAAVDSVAVVSQIRIVPRKVNSFVGRSVVRQRMVVDPTVASIRLPLPRTRSVLGGTRRVAAQPTPRPRPVVTLVRIVAAKVRAFLGQPAIKIIPPPPEAWSGRIATTTTLVGRVQALPDLVGRVSVGQDLSGRISTTPTLAGRVEVKPTLGGKITTKPLA